MNLSLNKYLFLSKYIPLPLSAISYIENNKSHPFYKISQLKRDSIIKELKQMNKNSKISINKIIEKVDRIENLIEIDIFNTIEEDIKKWNESGITILTYFDRNYPIRLKNIKNPPKVIFIKGNPNFEYNKAISIVGTRDPSEYGFIMAKKIGHHFAELGFVIVNGFAKGVDTEAIRGSLEAGGKIIGVLGSGLLNPYPKENLNLFNEILKKNLGVFISEQLPDKNVTKSTLATRNRISSALSLGNIFIEGSKTSGTRWQLKYGKEQRKSIIVLKPKKKIKQTELPRDIIKSEKNLHIIDKIEDIDQIAEFLIKTKSPKNASINDFL